MSGALAVAAGVLDIEVLYIDYKEYMPEFRKPKPTSTYIHLVSNPMKLSMDLFGGVRMEKALEFFNIAKFDVAKNLLEDAADRMGAPRTAQLCAGIAEFYRLWNAFSFSQARQVGEELFDKTIGFPDAPGSVGLGLQRLRAQIDTARKLDARDRIPVLVNFFHCSPLRIFQATRHRSASVLPNC